VISRTRK